MTDGAAIEYLRYNNALEQTVQPIALPLKNTSNTIHSSAVGITAWDVTENVKTNVNITAAVLSEHGTWNTTTNTFTVANAGAYHVSVGANPNVNTLVTTYMVSNVAGTASIGTSEVLATEKFLASGYRRLAANEVVHFQLHHKGTADVSFNTATVDIVGIYRD